MMAVRNPESLKVGQGFHAVSLIQLFTWLVVLLPCDLFYVAVLFSWVRHTIKRKLRKYIRKYSAKQVSHFLPPNSYSETISVSCDPNTF